jgi:hypothetical protein
MARDGRRRIARTAARRLGGRALLGILAIGSCALALEMIELGAGNVPRSSPGLPTQPQAAKHETTLRAISHPVARRRNATLLSHRSPSPAVAHA